MPSRWEHAYFVAVAALVARAWLLAAIVGGGACVRERTDRPAEDASRPSDAVPTGTSPLPEPWEPVWIGTGDRASAQDAQSGRVGDAFYISAAGAGQLLPERQMDDFWFVRSESSGDLELSARIVPTGGCPEPQEPRGRIGLMLRSRENDPRQAAYLFVGVDGRGQLRGQYRPSAGASAKALDLTLADASSSYVKLMRRQGKVTIALSKDRRQWSSVDAPGDLTLGSIRAGFAIAPSQAHCFALFEQPRLRSGAIPVGLVAAEIGWEGTGQVTLGEQTNTLRIAGGGTGIGAWVDRPEGQGLGTGPGRELGPPMPNDSGENRLAGDSLFFVGQPIRMPAETVARVKVSPAGGGDAGIMMRTTLDSVSAQISLLVNHQGDVKFAVRPDYDFPLLEPIGRAAIPADQLENGVYLRVVRTSETEREPAAPPDGKWVRLVVRAFWSTDGQAWNELPPQFIYNSETFWFAGLAVTAINATFDSLSPPLP